MSRAVPILLAAVLAGPGAAAAQAPEDAGAAREPGGAGAPASVRAGGGIAAPGVTIERLDLTRTPEIEARITVADAMGAWLHGLRADEFEVRLDGRPVELGRGGARLASRFVDGEHLTVLAVVDVSGSMRGALPDVRAALADFAARLGEEDEIGLLTVADAARVPLPPGAERERLVALLDSLPIGGNTAILDAVVAALDSLAGRSSPRRAVIVLSDGVDNRSRTSVEEAAGAARDRGIPVYGIALGSAADADALGALADASGGRVLSGVAPGDLRGIYSELAGLLESEYRLTIRLTDDQVGGWHRLSVALRSAPPGVPAGAERPFLASRTPGVDRGFVSGARAGHERGLLLRWWALGSLVALVPTLGLALVAARASGFSRAAPLALAILLAAVIGGLGALLWLAFGA